MLTIVESTWCYMQLSAPPLPLLPSPHFFLSLSRPLSWPLSLSLLTSWPLKSKNKNNRTAALMTQNTKRKRLVAKTQSPHSKTSQSFSCVLSLNSSGQLIELVLQHYKYPPSVPSIPHSLWRNQSQRPGKWYPAVRTGCMHTHVHTHAQRHVWLLKCGGDSVTWKGSPESTSPH